MLDNLKHSLKELRSFIILWITQSFSALGSAMTNFALIIWSYQMNGSALTTAMLAICSYTPYILLSIFAGVLSDRWNKKATMLVSDSFAALCTISVLILLTTGKLQINLLAHIFGTAKGSGAALLFFVIGIVGLLSCLPFRADKHIWRLEEDRAVKD